MSPTALCEAVTPTVWGPGRSRACVAAMALLFTILPPAVASAQPVTDPVTGFTREPVHVAAWPGGKKVAVSFALFVEEFGLGRIEVVPFGIDLPGAGPGLPP